MNPDEVTSDEKPVKNLNNVLDEQLALYNHSLSYRKSRLEPKAARAMKVLRGIPVEDTNPKSKVTGRQKIYFRKVWSSVQRILASFFQAFLQDKYKFKINGRDDDKDYIKAKVLEFITRYHLDRLMRRSAAFTRLMWAFMDCIVPGTAVVKLFWKFNEEYGMDEPDFVVYPLEQVCMDWEAESPDQMAYIYFENYLSKDKLEELGYENLDKIQPEDIPNSPMRSVRYLRGQDPAVNPSPSNYVNGAAGNSYPEGGTENPEQHPVLQRYLAVEGFYRKNGKVYFCVFNPASKVWLKKAEVSPYGKMIPAAIGHMLLEAHKLIPENIAEILEGPQESLNFNLNVRKDATLLAMAPGFIYGRYANVDKQALSKIYPGWTAAADDVQQIVPIKAPDVGQNAYAEASQDMAIIDEEGGVNQQSLGNSNTGKTGEAQINLAQSSAKLDYYTAVVSQTLFHQFIYILAYMIQLFETNEALFKKANGKLRQDGILPKDADNVYDIEFDMDVDIEVGVSEASRMVQAQRYASVIDRMLQMNNSTFMMMKSGIKIAEPKIYDVAKVGADLFPALGVPNTSQYLIEATPPPPEQPPQAGGGQQAQAVAGQNAAQPNEAAAPAPDQNEFMQNLMQQMGGGQ